LKTSLEHFYNDLAAVGRTYVRGCTVLYLTSILKFKQQEPPTYVALLTVYRSDILCVSFPTLSSTHLLS